MDELRGQRGRWGSRQEDIHCELPLNLAPPQLAFHTPLSHKGAQARSGAPPPPPPPVTASRKTCDGELGVLFPPAAPALWRQRLRRSHNCFHQFILNGLDEGPAPAFIANDHCQRFNYRQRSAHQGRVIHTALVACVPQRGNSSTPFFFLLNQAG